MKREERGRKMKREERGRKMKREDKGGKGEREERGRARGKEGGACTSTINLERKNVGPLSYQSTKSGHWKLTLKITVMDQLT